MFASIELASRIDHAEARLTRTLGATATEGFVVSIAGGVACYAAPDSPMNKLIGVGFDGLPSEAALAALEARFASRAAALQAEVATLADPALGALLTARGYLLQGFENVLGRPLTAADGDPRLPAGVSISPISPGDSEAWLEAAITGFLHPDAEGVPASALPPRSTLEAVLRPFLAAPGFDRYCTYLDGALAGVATLRLDAGVAQLCGAATLPAFRRRGVQSALLRHRLAVAVAAGCELAVLTTQPGSKSAHNGHRQGFALLYPRAVLVKPAA